MHKIFSFLLIIFIYLSLDTSLFAQSPSIVRDLEELGIFVNHPDQFVLVSKVNVQNRNPLPVYTFFNRNTSEIWRLKITKHPRSERHYSITPDNEPALKNRKRIIEKLKKKELKKLGGNLGFLFHIPNSNLLESITYETSIYYPVTALTVSGDKALINLTIYNVSNRNEISRKKWIRHIGRFMEIDR